MPLEERILAVLDGIASHESGAPQRSGLCRAPWRGACYHPQQLGGRIMAKERSFYSFHAYLRDRPAPPAFKCAQCGYLSRAGTPPLCEVCRHRVETVRGKADERVHK